MTKRKALSRHKNGPAADLAGSDRDLWKDLNRHCVIDSYNSLVVDGVPPDLLKQHLRLLGHPRLPPDSWDCETITGLSPREYKQALKAFKKAAAYLNRMAAHGYLVNGHECRRAACLLDRMADGFEASPQHLSNQPRNIRAIAMLVKLVQQSTGTDHDAETSALVHAITGQIPTAEAMKEWRRRNKALLERTPTLANNLAEPVNQAPPR